MKKLNLLTLSAALLMGLASCGGNNNASSTPASVEPSVPGSVTPVSEDPSVEPSTPAVDYAALAERAYQQISATYEDWAAGITSDQTIYLETTVDGVKFVIEYAISDEAKDYLKIEGDKLVVTADNEDHRFLNAVTVNVKFDGTVYATHKLNVRVAALATVKLSAIWDLKDGDAVTTRGKITAMYGKAFFMQDGAAGTEVYTSADWGVKVGDYVEVAGVISVYNGLYEIKPNKEGGVVILEGAGGVADPVNLDLDAEGVSLDVAKAVGGRQFSGSNLYVKSISVGTGSSNYHYIEGKLLLGGKDGTVELAIRIDDRYAAAEDLATWGWTESNGKISLDGTVEQGDTISVDGIITWYDKAQIALGTIKNVTKGEAIVATPVALADLYATGDDAIAADTLVSVKGKVIANYNAASQGGFFIADGEYGLYIYRSELPDGIVVGDYVSLEGNVATYKETRQISGAKKITKLADGTGIADPVALNSDAVLGYSNQSRLITLTGTLASISADSNGNVSGKINVGEKAFNFKFDSRYVDLENLAAAFGWAKDGSNYSITAVAGGTVTINGVSTYQSGNGSVFGITASDYVAPSEEVETPLSTIEEGWALSKGDPIKTRGKVTALYGTSFFIQDGSFGTEVYISNDTGVAVGDYVEVEGTVDVYNGFFEIKPSAATDVTVLEEHTDIDEPTVITLSEDMDLSEAKSVGGRLYSGQAVVKSISLSQTTAKDGTKYYVLSGQLSVGEKVVDYRLDDRYTDLESWGVAYDATGVATLGDVVAARDTVTVAGVVTWYNKAQIATATVSAVVKAAPEEEGSLPEGHIKVTKTVEELATANSWANAAEIGTFSVGEVNVTITSDTGSTTKFYDAGKNIRAYINKNNGTGQVAIAANSGYTIVSAKFTYVWNKGTGTFPVDSDEVDTVNAASKNYAISNPGSANEQFRLTALEFVYKAAE